MSLLFKRAVVDIEDFWPTDSTKYKIRAGVVLTVYGLYMVYAILTFVMFVQKSRDKHSGLSQRNVALVMLQSIGCIIMGSAAMVSTAIQLWPCFLRLWLVDIGFMMVYSSIAARALQHIVVSNVHILTNKLATSNAPALKGTMTPHSNLDYLRQEDGPRLHRSGSQTSIYSTTDFGHNESTQGMVLNEKKQTADIGSSRTERHASLVRLDNGPDSKTYRRLQKYTRLQRFVTNRSLTIFVLLNFMAACLMSLAINIVNKQFSISPMNKMCSMMWGFMPVTAIIAIYAVLILPVLLIKCWSLKDAYGIRNDLIISIIAGGLCVILTVLWETILIRIAHSWSGWFFTWLCAVVLHTVSLVLPLWAAIRHSRDVMMRMHGANGMGATMSAAIAGAGGEDGHLGKRAEFNSILADPYEYRFFCDFAASCFCSEMTAFIDEYQVLKGLTVIALGSEDMWREDVDQLESSYMARMANNIDGGIGYLAMANRAYPHSKSLRLQTPPTVSILETALAVYPQYDLSEVTPFPVASMDKLVAIFSVFVNSNSYTAVSLPSSMVLRIRERLGRSQLTLTILDEIKDEVLNMLYYDVFTRYAKRK
ncbi:hypothetical protein GGI09_002886 [Coemansia sp. S100]|nr:hypothetical protein LPJ71_000015 [Coemansia sp. S17]KAJ2099248.1 hypothetical protein GGI09_002886 [Coemansia sp. S100]KAJ2101402.1 hypothetical protein GGI16_003467 [Coemansia sp. S142-1]